ncbi:unnamed protein product [Menidia menidia]|uniref:(Atlantic silverside) hypothetical protein n=1 Tax=Menidia menidia TaxID=238744 RepID=A0A8S4AKV5_9TELE|nr:unnamed protein product [Menidia menidia]
MNKNDFFLPDCEGKDYSGAQTSSSSPSSSSSSSTSSQPGARRASQDFLGRFAQVNAPNSGDRKHRDASAVLPFIGLTNSAEQSRSCCKNGGTCILGSFCACPPFFTGRSCEYDTRHRMCDFIPHGEWVQKGCSYCRCGYGVLHCFPHVFHKDCGEIPFCTPPFPSRAVAQICDRQKLKWFWEQKIVQHGRQMDLEEHRVRSSALARLRERWVYCLDQRNQQQQDFFEERMRKVQRVQQHSP